MSVMMKTPISALALAAVVLASFPTVALGQLYSPGVDQPLTAAQIARETPPNTLTGAAVDKSVDLKSEGGMAIRVIKLAEGLSHPDGLVFLPDGHTMLVTERAGRLREIKDGILDPTPVFGLPTMYHFALGGLQDVVLHPDFARNHILYISYSKGREPRLGTTLAVARARYEPGRLKDVKDILVTEAWESPLGTYGGRMVFGPDGMLYLSVGDRDGTGTNPVSTARPQAQKLNSHIGKILRIRDDGSIPQDNPFLKTPDAKGEIFSLGHRNVYGMAWDPKTGQMWTSEFGPSGGDEINMEKSGHNYGWPEVSLGRNYTGRLMSAQPWYRDGFDMPSFFWNPTFNPENMIFYTGDRFPRLKGSLLIAGGGSKKIAQMMIRDADYINQGDTMLHELGVRFRDIRQGPDGYIYLLTEGRLRGPNDTDGMLLRLEPVPGAPVPPLTGRGAPRPASPD